MAVDVYSDNFAVGMISPRLSFSRDLDENESSSSTTTTNPILINDDYPCKLDLSLLDSTFDFAFNVDTNVTFQSSSADELFSDGKIIPTSLKKEDEIIKEWESQVVFQDKLVTTPCLYHQPTTLKKKSLKEFLEDSIEEEEEEEEEPAATVKPFWKFRRSNSLNCDRNQRKGLIGSWKILTRSGSTGKFLEKIVEEEKPNLKFQSKLFSRFTRNNSLNSENVTNNNNKKGLIRSSSKILRRSHSTSDYYFSKSDSSLFRRSNSTGSAPNKLKKQQSLRQQQQQQQQFDGNGKLAQKGK
ncbi:hypothetical protein SOVF_196110, partial [Spinacia oleracea]